MRDYYYGDWFYILMGILFFIIGSCYVFFTNITAIVWGAFVVLTFFSGVVIIIFGIISETILEKITGIIQGLVYISMPMISEISLRVADGHTPFDEAKFILWGSASQKFDTYMLSIMITVGIFIAIAVPVQVGKHQKPGHPELTTFFCVYTLILIAAIYIGGFGLTVRDCYNNSINKFDTEVPEYQLEQNTDIKTDFIFFHITTGKFKAEDKVYGGFRHYTERINGEEYVEVTDGKGKLGYVPEKYLKVLSTTQYVVNKECALYESEEYMGIPSIKVKATENVIRQLPVGTKIRYYLMKADNGYAKVELFDGTVGCILKENMDEVKIAVEE